MNTTRPSKPRPASSRSLTPHLLAALLMVLAALVACGEPTVDDDRGGDDSPNVTGESHWMESCEESAECGDGESCLCGVCTVSCQVNDACPAEAICASATQACTVAYCTETCAEDADCPNDLVCSDGFCAGPSARSSAPVDVRPIDFTPNTAPPAVELGGSARPEVFPQGLEMNAPDHTEHACTEWQDISEDGVELRSAFVSSHDASGAECVIDGLDALDDPYCGYDAVHADLVFSDGALVEGFCTPCYGISTPLEELPDYGVEERLRLDEEGQHLTLDLPSYPIDIVLGAPNVTVHGDTLTSQIEGDVTLYGRNTRLRNAEILGDVHVYSRNTALAHTHIQGDLRGLAAGLRLFNVRIDGDVKIAGSGFVWAGVEVSGSWDAWADVECLGCTSVERGNGRGNGNGNGNGNGDDDDDD